MKHRILALTAILVLFSGNVIAQNCDSKELTISDADWYSESYDTKVDIASIGSSNIEKFDIVIETEKNRYYAKSSLKIKPGKMKSLVISNIYNTPTGGIKIELENCNKSSSSSITYNQGSEYNGNSTREVEATTNREGETKNASSSETNSRSQKQQNNLLEILIQGITWFL